MISFWYSRLILANDRYQREQGLAEAAARIYGVCLGRVHMQLLGVSR